MPQPLSAGSIYTKEFVRQMLGQTQRDEHFVELCHAIEQEQAGKQDFLNIYTLCHVFDGIQDSTQICLAVESYVENDPHDWVFRREGGICANTIPALLSWHARNNDLLQPAHGLIKVIAHEAEGVTVINHSITTSSNNHNAILLVMGTASDIIVVEGDIRVKTLVVLGCNLLVMGDIVAQDHIYAYARTLAAKSIQGGVDAIYAHDIQRDTYCDYPASLSVCKTVAIDGDINLDQQSNAYEDYTELHNVDNMLQLMHQCGWLTDNSFYRLYLSPEEYAQRYFYLRYFYLMQPSQRINIERSHGYNFLYDAVSQGALDPELIAAVKTLAQTIGTIKQKYQEKEQAATATTTTTTINPAYSESHIDCTFLPFGQVKQWR